MNSYVRAIYEFLGEPELGEISIGVGEVLEITRTDVGEGWWEGKNARGKVGLFPEAYVEVLSAADLETYQKELECSPPLDSIQTDGDDSDDDTYQELPTNPGNKTLRNTQWSSINEADDILLPPTLPDMNDNSTKTTQTRKGSFFRKRADTFVLGYGNRDKLLDNDVIHIVPCDNYYQWKSSDQAYTVDVASPRKVSKFKGVKTFVAYQVTPSFNNVSVFRRFKHFLWLHQRLTEKFVLIPIPPLPEKQISGRYEEHFVEDRRIQLQEFVDWLSRHPVLSKCEVWFHFLTCTDDKVWKQGKRKAERDPYVGISYCWAISPPEKQLLPSYVDAQIENCSEFIQAMEGSVRNLIAISNDVTKRCRNQSRKEYQHVADVINGFSKSIAIDEERQSPLSADKSLAHCVAIMGDTYAAIAQQYGEQPKYDWIPFANRLNIYRSILSSFPDILTTHKSAVQKRQECERLTAEQKMSPTQMIDVNRRMDIISYAVMAEMSHFKKRRETHFKEAIKSLIAEQMKFYNGIIDKLKDAHAKFT
ncbi:sorting nexin lst-4-like [Haematobia irritans]|uniref:sorting nexin lst-4-like n=1 Tax=Haematobia irritans TaxID=7368 RepID=UPI003F4F4D1C